MEKKNMGRRRVVAQTKAPVQGWSQSRQTWPVDRKSQDYHVFMDNISKRIHHSTLKEAFSVYGEVIDVFIAYNKRYGKKTTFALVRYKKLTAANRAIEMGDGRLMDGHFIRVFKEKSFQTKPT
ncbi:serine/arginine-rich splicing factor SC35-like [Hibiscus syriacus]|uniref:serine/arginine-rich splicing factor SC35-like n=1 Tax=Hibiscus syriacus TaxID=106335 RepID=UPI001923F85A|nr:serine/arginine-rich splicing factor SC35-like [Hibiscus syriacus]